MSMKVPRDELIAMRDSFDTTVRLCLEAQRKAREAMLRVLDAREKMTAWLDYGGPETEKLDLVGE